MMKDSKNEGQMREKKGDGDAPVVMRLETGAETAAISKISVQGRSGCAIYKPFKNWTSTVDENDKSLAVEESAISYLEKMH